MTEQPKSSQPEPKGSETPLGQALDRLMVKLGGSRSTPVQSDQVSPATSKLEVTFLRKRKPRRANSTD